MDESEIARLANVASYATRDTIDGSPHLNHKSIWMLYRHLVSAALTDVGLSPEVLELGAGSGEASGPWIEAGARLTAVDCSRPQLRRLRMRYPSATTVEMDNAEFLREYAGLFDVVSIVSTLHHIPDYEHLLRQSIGALRPNGALLTFQDPLRYDTLPRAHRIAALVLYAPWRLSRGDVFPGIRRRLRRTRGVLLANDPSDNEEYHVVRNGVDSDAIEELLSESFAHVEVVTYFSTQARISQRVGDWIGLRSTFGILATGRIRPSSRARAES